MLLATATLLAALTPSQSFPDDILHTGFEDYACGNTIVEDTEVCDDGNPDDDDTCNTACRTCPLDVPPVVLSMVFDGQGVDFDDASCAAPGGCLVPQPLDANAAATLLFTSTFDPARCSPADPAQLHRWDIFRPPAAGGAEYAARGMRQLNRLSVTVSPSALPDAEAFADPYWRARLTVTHQGPVPGATVVEARFRYVNSTIDFGESANCQLAFPMPPCPLDAARPAAPEVYADAHVAYFDVVAGAPVVLSPVVRAYAKGFAPTSATVRISGNFNAAQDVLALPPAAGFGATFDTGNGQLTITGTGSADAWQAVLRTVTYDNSGAPPTTNQRVVAWRLSDDVGGTSETSSSVVRLVAPSP